MAIIVRTLAERTFDAIRERIVAGRLPAMEPVRQDALAKELGVSKIPLREALARLEREGLVTSQPNRGWFVQPMTTDLAEEIYELRLSFEPQAAARGARLASNEERNTAIEAFERLDTAAEVRLDEVGMCNRHFHVALVRPGQRSLTTQLTERLEILAERYVVAHLEPAGRGDRAHIEHRGLLDAWLARDEASVRDLLTRHLTSTLDDLRAHFAARPD